MDSPLEGDGFEPPVPPLEGQRLGVLLWPKEPQRAGAKRRELLQYYCGVGHQGLDELDAEMVAIAKAIIAQRTGSFDPTTYRDRYQEALQELIEAKMRRGSPLNPGRSRPRHPSSIS